MTKRQAALWAYLILICGFFVFLLVVISRTPLETEDQERMRVFHIRETGEKRLAWCKRVCPDRTDAGFNSKGDCICVAWPIPCPDDKPKEETWQLSPP